MEKLIRNKRDYINFAYNGYVDKQTGLKIENYSTIVPHLSATIATVMTVLPNGEFVIEEKTLPLNVKNGVFYREVNFLLENILEFLHTGIKQ